MMFPKSKEPELPHRHLSRAPQGEVKDAGKLKATKDCLDEPYAGSKGLPMIQRSEATKSFHRTALPLKLWDSGSLSTRASLERRRSIKTSENKNRSNTPHENTLCILSWFYHQFMTFLTKEVTLG